MQRVNIRWPTVGKAVIFTSLHPPTHPPLHSLAVCFSLWSYSIKRTVQYGSPHVDSQSCILAESKSAWNKKVANFITWDTKWTFCYWTSWIETINVTSFRKCSWDKVCVIFMFCPQLWQSATFILLSSVITQTFLLYVPVGRVPSRDRWYCVQVGQSRAWA